MDRRQFIQHSAAVVAGTSVLLSACRNGNKSQISNDQMANDPYGEADRMNEVNKEMVNDQIAHV